MGIEQNLDEMLRSLQMSVDNLSDGEDAASSEGEDYAEISTSDLQKILEEKYFSEGSVGKHESDGSYELDDAVLAQFFESEEETEEVSEETPIEGSPVVDEPYSFDAFEDEAVEQNEADELLEDLEELVTVEDAEIPDELEALEFSDVENEPETVEFPDVENEPETIEAPEVTDEYDEPVSDYDEIDVIDMQTMIDDETSEASSLAELVEPEIEDVPVLAADENKEGDETPEFDPYGAAPAEKPKSFKALIMDYGRPDPIPTAQSEALQPEEAEAESDYETPDVGDILSDFADDSPTREDKMNSAVHKFMSSLGCEDELASVSAEDIGAIYGQFGEQEIQEEPTVSAERREEKRAEYRKSTFGLAVKLSVCAALTFLMLLYDTLPILDVDFIGISDYTLYPGAYVMIGAQLLLICAAVMWRDIWRGIKGLLSVYPNIYSMAAVAILSCVCYDLIFFITGSYKPLQTPMFHFLCGILLTVVGLYSVLMNMRESATYNMYSADVARFTLSRDKSPHSVGEKMYSGGFSKDKKVYAPSTVAEPKGFFDAISEGGSFNNAVFSSLILMSVGIGVIFGIILLIVGRTIEESSIAAMSTIMAMTPVSAVAAIFVPMTVSFVRLRKRGIALTGRRMIRKYGAKNALVFSDLHLFSKCDPQDIGFVCYEKIQTKNVLSALNILYSRIGGPMGEVFSNIPDEYKAKSIRVRRITRSGIEAVVDRSHVLLVGDVGFMRRYGIEFPPSGANKGNDSIFVSLDGRASARLMSTYKVEPVFDMLIERLAKEGIHCVIETYDPMINTAFAARHRRPERAPISVVHKNAADINRPQSNAKKRSDHGLLALSSRLKLAEAVVWCARLCDIERILNITVYVSIALGTLTVGLLGAFGLIPCMIQQLLLAYTLLSFGAVTALTLVNLPKRGYFTADALANEDKARESNERK